MCDNLTAQDAEQYLEASGVSRRTFAKMGAGAAAMAALPPVANAQDITSSSVLVPTPDGMMDAYFVHPTRGEHAAVILWPDILGLRPAFRQMGERLAQSGFAVLVVNPYYRTVAGEVVSVGASFRDQETRDKVLPLARTLSPTTCVTDGNALVEFLDAQSAVDNSKKIGTAGYCMTGSYVIRLAAAIPNRIGAGASFHGGGLVTDAADSPHLLAPQIQGGLLIAIAENDHEREPESRDVLIAAMDDAGVSAEIEVYEGAQHGWCPPDSAVYHPEQAERAWSRMLHLFGLQLS